MKFAADIAFTQSQKLVQRQQLSQSQIQSLEILSLDQTGIQNLLQEEYLENPLLDYTGTSERNGDLEKLKHVYEKASSYKDGNSYSQEKEETLIAQLVAEKENEIGDYLLSQLKRQKYMKDEWKIFEFLTECLDKNGFFTLEPQEIVNIYGYNKELLEKCLNELRELEPYGIFSRNLKECLLKQLEILGLKDTPAWDIVEYYLEDLTKGRLSTISRGLKLSTLQVRKHVEQIGKLNPIPLNGFQLGKVNFTIPDVIVSKDNGEWRVDLNDGWIKSYSINDYYYKMMKNTSDKEMQAYFKTKLERIHFIMNSIEQRRQTILNIVRVITQKQELFLQTRGVLQPMTMADVAQILNIHSSTVSRAVRDKYLQYPGGSILMKDLFVGSLPTDNAEGATHMHIKNQMKQLILEEDKKNPYSDLEIVQRLQQQGLKISRRTVAKYRQELGIKGSFDRRHFDEMHS